MYIILFFNTAIVMVFVGANLENWLPFKFSIFEQFVSGGKFKDFTGEWYIVVGGQIILNSGGDFISPQVTYFFNGIFFKIFMCLDQRKCRNKKRYPNTSETRCRTISEYYEYYSGPDYVIENNQAALLNFILTCFLFGAGLPMLFPIALICLLILYYYEKKTICRQVRKPPDFEPKANDHLVDILLDGPILYSLFGYWMYSNPLLIHSKPITPILFKNDSLNTNHCIVDAFTEVTPATPFLILLFISVLTRIEQNLKLHKKFCRETKL